MFQRTPETQKRYDQARAEGTTILQYDDDGKAFFDLSRVSLIKYYTYWVMIANDFPYDAIFTTHNMLIPKRVFAFLRDATDAERQEYFAIRKELDDEAYYDSIIENFFHSRSAKKHFHAHVVHWKS